jgi:hypothetical protein
MSALVDIAPVFADVKVGDTDIRQHGLDGSQLAKLIIRFPKLYDLYKEVQEAFADSEGDLDVQEAVGQLDHVALAKVGREAIGAIIAYSTGDDDDPKAEAVASRLPVGLQIVFLKNAFTLSFPNGSREAMETMELVSQ